MYKIAKRPRKGQMSMYFELHNLTMVLKPMPLKDLMLLTRAYVVSWLGLPVSYPTDSYDYHKFLTGQRINHQDGKLVNVTIVEAIKDLRAESEAFANKYKTKNCHELELQAWKDSQNEIVLFCRCRWGNSFTFGFG